jgi:hypothetical protein
MDSGKRMVTCASYQKVGRIQQKISFQIKRWSQDHERQAPFSTKRIVALQ